MKRKELIVAAVVDISSRCERKREREIERKQHTKERTWTDGQQRISLHMYIALALAWDHSAPGGRPPSLEIKWLGIYSLADNKWPGPASSSSSKAGEVFLIFIIFYY